MTTITFRDTAHDDTRRERLRQAYSQLYLSCPAYVYGSDNTIFYECSNGLARIQAHISDIAWGVRLSRRG